MITKLNFSDFKVVADSSREVCLKFSMILLFASWPDSVSAMDIPLVRNWPWVLETERGLVSKIFTVSIKRFYVVLLALLKWCYFVYLPEMLLICWKPPLGQIDISHETHWHWIFNGKALGKTYNLKENGIILMKKSLLFNIYTLKFHIPYRFHQLISTNILFLEFKDFFRQD